MLEVSYNIKIVLVLTVGFALASFLGYFAERFKFSSILGYLLAGFIIGPFSPGYVTDLGISEQLAEVGVILMLFSVGLHFKWQDLMDVKNIAVPGAVGQLIISALIGACFIYLQGWSFSSGIIIGLAIGVASTVVLVRVLTDYHLIETREGHIAIGWLIVEDILTVAVLILLPMFAKFFHGEQVSLMNVANALGLVFLKFAILAFLMFTLGHLIVNRILISVAKLRSHELFTATVLALIFVIATGSSLIFGTSIALGAFIAGMVIGQTVMRQQASANALPMKDAFTVIFFLSVGMLFNPAAISEHFTLFMGILIIILLVKPIAALLIILGLHYPFKTGLTVAFALAQIGEFSFILAEESLKLDLIPDQAYDIIVACALISIGLNPLLFKFAGYFEEHLEAMQGGLRIPKKMKKKLESATKKAVIIGFGPIGRCASKILETYRYKTIVIDRNVETIEKLENKNEVAVYGDATQPQILESAHVSQASVLIITTPDINTTKAIIEVVRHLNRRIQILARIEHLSDSKILNDLNVRYICAEEEIIKDLPQAIQSLIQD